MEERKEMNDPVENVVPDEMMPGFVAAESQKKHDEETVYQTECPAPELQSDNLSGSEEAKQACDKKRKCCHIGHLIFDLLMAAAVITLFILHFCGNKRTGTPIAVDPSKAGTGEVLYVNIDSINEHYEMVSILTDSIDAERQRQTVLFQNRQKALENKLANYQRNMQSGSLTAQQAQYAEQSLQQESAQLQNDYSVALENLESRYTAALGQIADSLKVAVARANATHNASFILSYGAGSPVIEADPTKDITQEVLEDLNKPFKKKKKGGN
ncbi:MAG: OmpH family outer membrane protein [Bacteroidales bacterium]|nr:OmpH family outer membrane protein [Bacteroidales bacterium]